jgi:hypothetical protein
MALFVIGAGATRGASFVDATKSPCLPFLDRDFFTQLQRIRNPKHQRLVKAVMKDAVDLFGSNFEVTMESMFTTLEHTIRMLGTTGENRAFNKKELKEKRDRLEQAIAATLEEALTIGDEEGHSTQNLKECEFHDCLVKDILEPGDEIISFNYDCVIDDSLKRNGNNKWNPRYGYGFYLGAKGSRLTGDKHWTPTDAATREKTLHLPKLHGSLHFQVSGTDNNSKVRLKQHPYTKKNGNLEFTIIPPEWHKAYDKGVFATLWKNAAAAINRAQHIIIIGYSLPVTDLHSTALFRTSVRPKRLKSLIAVNPDPLARKRIRSVLQLGLSPETRVLSVDRLAEFVSINRKTWDH